MTFNLYENETILEALQCHSYMCFTTRTVRKLFLLPGKCTSNKVVLVLYSDCITLGS